jgi:hydrogenase expression/formation protein HypD
VILPAIGFETTQPPIAAAVLEAEKAALGNFFLIPAGRLIPPALEYLLDDPETRIDGLICPGHVSVIIGLDPYRTIARQYRLPCVVAGFEPLDILGAIRELLGRAGKGEAVNLYPRAVRDGGNPKARRVVEKVFTPADAEWRGLGTIPDSGLVLGEAYRRFDIDRVDPIAVPEPSEDPGCICGRVLRGVSDPADCPRFGSGCDPAHPLGPCMVSSEGACAAWFRYGRREAR